MSGTTVSIVQVWPAGVGSTLPAASLARTLKLWLPSARLLVLWGEAQAVKAAASSEHSNIVPSSLLLKVNVALLLRDGLYGLPVSVVSGATVSTVQVWPAGVGSSNAAASMALTWNVWLPSARLL